MAIEAHIAHDIAAKREARPIDAAIGALATAQHGVVSGAQLVRLGVQRGALAHRVAAGRLHPLHRGVFAVGHRLLSREAAWMAAVLAVGESAVLSHRSAAALWGMRDTARSGIEVSVPRHRRPRAGIEVHHTVLAADEVTVGRGIPVTNPARTLLDLAAVISEPELEHALNEAEIRRLTSPVPLDVLVARYPGRKGVAAAKRALQKQREIGETVTRSRMERRFLELVDAYGIPRPRMNEPLGPYQPDALWSQQRVVVELDSYDIHTTRRAFERDRARDRALTTAGYRVIRISWRQLQHEPHVIAQQLSVLLGAGVGESARTVEPASPCRAVRERGDPT